MNDAFKFIEKLYSLRTTSHFRSRKIRTTKYGIETPSYLGPKLWNLVPNEYKTIESLADFKAKIKTDCMFLSCHARFSESVFVYELSGCGFESRCSHKNKNLGLRELSLQVMQNIYSPNRFYLSSPQDNSRILKKSQYIYKMIFTLLYRYNDFSNFG